MSDNVLSGAQRKALAALLEGRSVAGAAEAANVTPRTLARWQGDSVFRAELERGQREVLAETVRALQTTARQAVEFLGVVLTDDAARPSDRLRAAGMILTAFVPVIDALDVQERLERLEARANDTN